MLLLSFELGFGGRFVVVFFWISCWVSVGFFGFFFCLLCFFVSLFGLGGLVGFFIFYFCLLLHHLTVAASIFALSSLGFVIHLEDF